MTDTSVRTSSITKRYGTDTALHNVSISVEPGSVYGLVGPNGAGKTTLLSLLAGLRRPTSGTLQVTATRLGVLPDTPLFERWLTGREVVALAHSLAPPGIPPERIDEVLDAADLGGAKHRKVGGYSRGMLQRLGLAATVVAEPDLLLLDEPAAALDPRGRREVLDLVTELRGRSTVLFSSHILDDVEQVCDTIGILAAGELVYEGSLERLLAIHGSDRTYRIEADDPVSLRESLLVEPWVESARLEGMAITVVGTSAPDIRSAVVPFLGSTGMEVTAVTPVRRSLEDVFLEVTR
ncbi:MAG: ABC transporter ATP-binding protein [Acidimicrobiia bacterium]